MKNIVKIITITIILISSACTTKPTEEVTITQVPLIPTKTTDAYPVQQMEAYPSPLLIEESDTELSIVGDIPNPSAETPDPDKSPVIISNINHDTNGIEAIYITNISKENQDINGYSLIIPSTSEHINIFNVILEPGDSFVVYNGKGAAEKSDGLAWLEIQAIQQPGDSVFLLNRAGRLIWPYIYNP